MTQLINNSTVTGLLHLDKPIIAFDNFIARELELNDAEMFCELILKNKNRIASSFPSIVKVVNDLASAREFILNRAELARRREAFSFILFDNHKPIAGLTIKNIDWTIPKGELGYYIDEQYEGKGITTRFVEHICNYAFDQLQFNKIFMRIRDENTGSKKVAEKNNFKVEGHLLKDYRNFENELVDVIYYGKLK